MTIKDRQEIEDCFNAIDEMRQTILGMVEVSVMESVDLDDDDAVEKMLERTEYKNKWLAAWVDKGSDKFTFNYDEDNKEFTIKFKGY